LKADGDDRQNQICFRAAAFNRIQPIYDGAISDYLSNGNLTAASAFSGAINSRFIKFGTCAMAKTLNKPAVPRSASGAGLMVRGTVRAGDVVQQQCRRRRSLKCVKVSSEPACVIVKHANRGRHGRAGYGKAFKTDIGFGGIIALNCMLVVAGALQISSNL
jgi:AICAR transformylase/IMP cyclohydrolase PurH